MDQKFVRDLMSSEVTTVDRNDALSIADRIMTLGRIRHIPVLDDGRLCGIVTQRDLIFNALARALGYGSFVRDKTLSELRVKSAMTEEVHTTRADAPIEQAAQTLKERKIGCLPVVESGSKLVGILTEGDFVAAFAARNERKT